jgi:hypothetical protein
MLSFVTKEQYWAAEDAGVLDLYPANDWWHIKNIQDAIVLHRYRDLKGNRIADIGGSDSRTLRHFGKANDGYCIDSFEGDHGGVSTPPKIRGVRNVRATLGDLHPDLPTGFDVLYSISVVEHVPPEKVGDFFEDCRRILKPGGEMMHLIDLYVETDPSGNVDENARLELYRNVFNTGFEPLGPMILPEGGIAFDCSYATNPDNMMNRWNRSVPQLRSKRARSQACSLILHARRL